LAKYMSRNRNVLDLVCVCRLQNVGWKLAGSLCIEEESLRALIELVVILFSTLRITVFLKRMLLEVNQLTGSQTIYSTRPFPQPVLSYLHQYSKAGRSWTELLDFRRLSLSEFLDTRYMKVARSSTQFVVRLYPAGDSPGTDSCESLSRSQGRKSKKNPSYSIGN
jgi:hypothetical protein